MLTEETKRLCRLFADVMDYPDDSIENVGAECLGELLEFYPDSAAPMKSFLKFVSDTGPGELEELYTQTFDVVSTQTLFVGFHLFGENPKRSTFMVRLEEEYQSHQFSSGTELADHLCVILRFLIVARDPEFVIPLIDECLLPVLDKLEKTFKKDKNSYGAAVRSVNRFLKQVNKNLGKTGGLINA